MDEPHRDGVGNGPRPREEGGALHPMGVVTQRTGLSAHALRAWERRYGVVEPTRSEGGHRLYSDADVERLLVLRYLTLGGRPIGQIAGLPTATLRELLEEDRQAEATAPGAEPTEEGADEAVRALLASAYASVRSLDPGGLDALLRRSALTLSAGTFLDAFLLPLMTRIGDAWEDGELSPAHEHLATAVASRVGGWLMDYFEPSGDAPCLVVTTPSGQRHELGALAAAVTAASEGWRVRYLGADLPACDAAAAVRQVDAAAVALSLVYPPGDAGVADELLRLRDELPAGLPLLVGGAAAESYDPTLEEIHAVRLSGFASFRAVLGRLAEEAGHAPLGRAGP